MLLEHSQVHLFLFHLCLFSHFTDEETEVQGDKINKLLLDNLSPELLVNRHAITLTSLLLAWSIFPCLLLCLLGFLLFEHSTLDGH